MLDLAQLLRAHPFPAALERVRRSFARQPDDQTCGAVAIRHGLLLGGLTIPTGALEAMLDIRANEGTAPATLRACLRRFGLGAHPLRKPARQATAAFLDGLRGEFDRGAFLLPCIHAGEHWVCVGAWQDGRIGLVDSYFGQLGLARGSGLSPGLGFFSLSPDELDALDWPHFITLVRPGRWRAQYEPWLPARPALLRMPLRRAGAARPRSVVEAVRLGAHQFLDDADYSYRGIHLHLPGGAARIEVEDPGRDAVGVETLGGGANEVVVLRRLGGAVTGRLAAPELLFRARCLGAANLGEPDRAPTVAEQHGQGLARAGGRSRRRRA
jgi:hypothetical protein